MPAEPITACECCDREKNGEVDSNAADEAAAAAAAPPAAAVGDDTDDDDGGGAAASATDAEAGAEADAVENGGMTAVASSSIGSSRSGPVRTHATPPYETGAAPPPPPPAPPPLAAPDRPAGRSNCRCARVRLSARAGLFAALLRSSRSTSGSTALRWSSPNAALLAAAETFSLSAGVRRSGGSASGGGLDTRATPLMRWNRRDREAVGLDVAEADAAAAAAAIGDSPIITGDGTRRASAGAGAEAEAGAGAGAGTGAADGLAGPRNTVATERAGLGAGAGVGVSGSIA
jgi:hypothetical protein